MDISSGAVGFPSISKDFLAKGGFEISATYENKRADNIKVYSLAGNKCRIVLPQSLHKVDVFDKNIHKNVPFTIIPAQNEFRERVEWQTQKGHEYAVFAY
jgi:hypothetical protein